MSWVTQWVAALASLQSGPDRTSPRDLERRAHQVAHFAWERLRQADYSLSQAHFVLARAHGFQSWPRLVHHVEGLAHLESGISAFERAADAIVDGDLSTLQRLLHPDPGLVRVRSSREHRVTLLHYVSANGVESYRQRTPSNIEAITRYLLDAGAEVDAEADVYGGGLTTFSLVVTSAHPRLAGVQNAWPICCSRVAHGWRACWRRGVAASKSATAGSRMVSRPPAVPAADSPAEEE